MRGWADATIVFVRVALKNSGWEAIPIFGSARHTTFLISLGETTFGTGITNKYYIAGSYNYVTPMKNQHHSLILLPLILCNNNSDR